MDKSDVSMENDITYEVADHQILLSFNSDWQAVEFYEWWQEYGEDYFIDHVNDLERQRSE